MSKFIDNNNSLFLESPYTNWESEPEFVEFSYLTGDFVEWDCEASGHASTAVNGDISASLAEWDGQLDGAFSEHGIEGDFQLWNGVIYANMNIIDASFREWTCSIESRFAFNHFDADFAVWDGELFAGANIEAEFPDWDCSISGAAGVSAVPDSARVVQTCWSEGRPG